MLEYFSVTKGRGQRSEVKRKFDLNFAKKGCRELLIDRTSHQVQA